MTDRTHQRGLFQVALRKESVDRNIGVLSRVFCYFVALRKESVDRNSVFDFLDLPNV